jgi:DNA-binding LacI/PurR family transcriptional regulator
LNLLIDNIEVPMPSRMIRPDSPAPIRQQLRQILLHEITSGVFTAGGRIPSERELAARYRISRASVRETITELINAGVLFRTVGRGTFVAGPARPAQPQTPTRDIAFLINEEIFHFVQTGYSEILRGVEEACRERGDRLIFQSVGISISADGLLPEGSAKPYGCIVAGGLKRYQLQRLRQLDVPFVLVDLLIRATEEDIISVKIDYAGGTRLALEHLYNLGHRQIGFIGFAGSEKYTAFWQTLETLGLRYDPRWVEFLEAGDLEPGMLAGFHAMQALLARSCPPTALLATNDYVARGVMEALGMARLKIPERISIVGYDDLGVHVSPPLTTIRTDLNRVGRLATEALYRRIEGAPVDSLQTLVQVDLIVRQSTALPPQLNTD